MRAFWNTYRPLCMNAHGQRASEIHSIPPFVDASCRREPDLEHAWPAISALCRGRAFAPRLRVGDLVVYATTRASDRQGGWRVTGVLQVVEAFPDHSAGARWYLRRGLPLPSNCLVDGNPPRPLAHTAEPHRDLAKWDDSYRAAIDEYSAFRVCRALYVNLHTPPRVSSEVAIEAFGRLPQSRTPLDWGARRCFVCSR